MKPDEFLNIKKEMDKWTDKLLFEKSKEYGTDDDRFDNIRAISRISCESVETCLKVLICKHIASYLDILDGKLEPTEDIIREKFGDIHNYLYITEGILREYNEKDTQIPVVELTKAEFEEDLRKTEIRKKAEKMYEDWNKENYEFHYGFKTISIGNASYYFVAIDYNRNKLMLSGYENQDVTIKVNKATTLPKPSDEQYILIFEKLLTDPEKFIKSYFGV